MATLYKPTIITYRLKDGSYWTPDGKRVTKNTPGAKRFKTKSKKWHARYTDGSGRPIRKVLDKSKETSDRILAKLAGEALLERFGADDVFQEHRERPLLEHLEDYRRFLKSKGNTSMHVTKTCSRVQTVVQGCGFRLLKDLQASEVIGFISGLREHSVPVVELDPHKEEYTKAELAALVGIHPGSVARVIRRDNLPVAGKGRKRRYPRETVQALQDRLCCGIGIATFNHYLTAIKGFSRWLARDRRIPADPLSHLGRLNPDVDIRHPRRALREEAFAQFVEATGKGNPFRDLTGPDRLVLYTLAANTGFRASELASLSPSSFSLDAQPPMVRVAAAYSKRRRNDVQPLRPDVAELLRQYMAGKPRGQAVWPGNWHKVAAEMVRADLAVAGIPYQDEDGRYFDFHAMRGQFISFMAAKGVHPKVAQVLARHSSITLTMDFYTHLDVLDVGGALEKLPGIPGSPKETEKGTKPKSRATGRSTAQMTRVVS